jgi:hypothetical protein
MNYNEYLVLLNKNNIKLFDYEKRISYYNIQNYKLTTNQKGGGINNKSEFYIKNIVNISLSSTPQLLLGLLN